MARTRPVFSLISRSLIPYHSLRNEGRKAEGMANDYSCIGFPVNADADLNRLYTDNRALLDRLETPEGTA